MNLLLMILGQIWLSPITCLVLLGLGVLRLFKQVKLTGRTRISFIFTVIPDSMLYNYMVRGNWGGWSGGACIVIKPPLTQRLVAHENFHVLQQLLFGITFPFVYLFEMLLVKYVKKGRAYYDNRFEVDARAYAAIIDNQNNELNKCK